MHRGALVRGLVGRRAGRPGAHGLEFADHRPYRPGDDLRRIDWNVYARLGQAFVKTAPAEASIDVALLLDASASMGAGAGSAFRYGQRLAALVGAVALLGSDTVELHALSEGAAWTGGTLRAPRDVLPLVAELGSVPRGVTTDLTAGLVAYRREQRGAAVDVAILVSDALVDGDDLAGALVELARGAATAALVHVQADPAPSGDGPTELRDAETGERLVVDVTPALREEVRLRAQARARDAAARAAAAGVSYVAAVTSRPPLDLLLAAARRAELVAVA